MTLEEFIGILKSKFDIDGVPIIPFTSKKKLSGAYFIYENRMYTIRTTIVQMIPKDAIENAETIGDAIKILTVYKQIFKK